jgi:hypothetical protein
MTTSPWHDDPALARRFHPDHPDDLEVMVHDGEPRRTGRAPEACWVTVTALHGQVRIPVALPDAVPPVPAAQVTWTPRSVYAGRLLNQPHHLTSTKQGDRVLFMVVPGLPHPLLVGEAYLAERGRWSFIACDRCGADQALDPPTIMARTRFPNAPAGAVPVAFTAICPCGGTMALSLVEGSAPVADEPAESPRAKPWWKFW